MKKLALVVLIGAIALFNIARNGFMFVLLIMIYLSPFMLTFWLLFLRSKGKPFEREGDMHIMNAELARRGEEKDV